MAQLTVEEKRDVLKRHFLLQHLRDWDLELLARHSRQVEVGSGDTIFRKHDSGDTMFVVVSGRVVICSQSPDGREVVFNIINPGEVFGEIAFLDGRSRTADARVLEDATCIALDRRSFLPFLEEHPKVVVELLLILCERVRSTTVHIEDTAFLEFRSRLAKKLVGFGQYYGKEVEQGSRIELSLSQTELGAMLQATRESVNRQMRRWVKKGIIEVDKKSITLVDMDRLEAIADDCE
jgi:CRP-like cAMP-binding protein